MDLGFLVSLGFHLHYLLVKSRRKPAWLQWTCEDMASPAQKMNLTYRLRYKSYLGVLDEDQFQFY